MENEILLSEELISNKIYFIRNQKVMLDSDLALLYGIETKRLKEAVKRNITRFPEDFMFELTEIEYDSLRSQIATLKKGRGQHQKYLPSVFTEHGVLMLSSVLNSDKAIHPRRSRTERS
jgi:ORF6N domain